MITQMQGWSTTLERWLNECLLKGEEAGQGLVEYALIILLISVATIGGLSTFGVGANSLYASIVARLPF